MSVQMQTSNASSALGLLASGHYDKMVSDFLDEGESFCVEILIGEKAHDTDLFSVRTLTACRLRDSLLRNNEGREVARRAEAVLVYLKALRSDWGKNPENAAKNTKGLIEDLHTYFLRATLVLQRLGA